MYAHTFYDRLCFNLEREGEYAVGSGYVQNPTVGQSYYSLQTNDSIKLTLKQIGTGVLLGNTIGKTRFDFGVGLVWYQNGSLSFSKELDYSDKAQLAAHRVDNVVAKESAITGKPYALASIAFNLKPSSKGGNMYLRFSGMAQQMAIVGTDAFALYKNTGGNDYRLVSISPYV